ncbi:histone-lysine N-methyltransferase SETMAR [Trichonephila clavipes]|nr:histone-lysine N-methyltransferase SETMAR [Trichonephila clavipes]
MESDKQHFRHILLFKNAVQVRKKLTDVYGEGVLTARQCQNWFAKFRSGNFDVEDAPRSGRPVEADKDSIKELVDVNRRIPTREIGLRLNLSNSTVYDHLKGLGLSSNLDVWVPHVLTERNLCRRIDVCDSLLKGHENYPFLKRIITRDEKGHGAKKMNRLKPFPKPIFTKKRVNQTPSAKSLTCILLRPSLPTGSGALTLAKTPTLAPGVRFCSCSPEKIKEKSPFERQHSKTPVSSERPCLSFWQGRRGNCYCSWRLVMDCKEIAQWTSSLV